MYILDTNVLVHDPQALFSFENTTVGIPAVVLQELDRFKSENTQRGRNSREVIRLLDLLRDRGSLRDGVDLDNGSKLEVLFMPASYDLPLAFDIEDSDNQILATAQGVQQSGADVTFISKDINMRIKADVLGIATSDYMKDAISENQFYKGWITLQVPSIQLKKPLPEDLYELEKEYNFTLNEFIVVESRNNPYNYRVFRYKGAGNFQPVEQPTLRWPVVPKNVQQLMALDLLLDPAMQMVTLLGPAGTGKTFLALVAGLHLLLVKEDFEKMLVTRPVIPLGPDIGYLPGDIQEKMHSWMQPVYDNMDFIVHTANASQQAFHHPDDEEQHEHEKHSRYKRRKMQREKGMPGLEDLIKRGKISLEAITYMRGRSIPYQYILIDEVQNLTPHEVKTLISRVGEGSKIILCGDPFQIDSPYLDFLSNGLVVASQRFKGQPLFGTVFLETSERSELSRLAGELL